MPDKRYCFIDAMKRDSLSICFIVGSHSYCGTYRIVVFIGGLVDLANWVRIANFKIAINSCL